MNIQKRYGLINVCYFPHYYGEYGYMAFGIGYAITDERLFQDLDKTKDSIKAVISKNYKNFNCNAGYNPYYLPDLLNIRHPFKGVEIYWIGYDSAQPEQYRKGIINRKNVCHIRAEHLALCNYCEVCKVCKAQPPYIRDGDYCGNCASYLGVLEGCLKNGGLNDTQFRGWVLKKILNYISFHPYQ